MSRWRNETAKEADSDVPRLLPAHKSLRKQSDLRPLRRHLLLQPKKEQETVTLEDMTQELAAALRDVITETPDKLEDAPDEVHRDLAVRFIHRIAGKLVILPPEHELVIERAKRDSAVRVLEFFEVWLSSTEKPRSILIERGYGQKFEACMREAEKTYAFFGGESVHDACAQAATAMSFGEVA